jgi:hypothetical protein
MMLTGKLTLHDYHSKDSQQSELNGRRSTALQSLEPRRNYHQRNQSHRLILLMMKVLMRREKEKRRRGRRREGHL